MTFGEFMDKLNELYVGNERDYKNMNVMVAVDSTYHPFSEFVLYPGEVVMCDANSAGEDRVDFVHTFIDGAGREIAIKEGENNDKL